MQTNKTDVTHRTHIEKAYVAIWSYRSTWRSCPCTSSLVAANEHFHRKESGYKLEETVRSSQENMDTLRFQMILECHRALIGMPPFVVAMKEGRYGLWRLRADDDDDDFSTHKAIQRHSRCIRRRL